MSAGTSPSAGRTISLALIALILSTAACGGSTPRTTPTTSTSPSPSPTPCDTVAPGPVELCGVVNDGGTADVTDQGRVVALTLETPNGFRFSPTYVKAEPGAEVTVTLVNTSDPHAFGSVHAFTILSLDVSEVVDPGETVEFTFDLPEGEPHVPFLCTIGGPQGHQAAGMQGAFYFD